MSRGTHGAILTQGALVLGLVVILGFSQVALAASPALTQGAMALGWSSTIAVVAGPAATGLSPAQPSSAAITLSNLPDLPAMPPDIQQVLERGKLIVAVLGQDNTPFFMANDGQLSGLDIRLAQSLADQLGVSLEITRLAQTFDQVVDTVSGREADLAISKISRTLKRAQRVRFSQPYLKMRQGLLVNRLQMAQQTQGRSMVETIRDLQGEVGVIKGSSYVGFLNQRFPRATIVEYPTWEDVVDAVVQGDILAAYRDELEIKKVVRTKPDAALKLQTIALTDTQDSLAVVLPWTSTHLLAFVDQYLDALASQYTVDTVLDTYADYWTTQSSESP